MGISGPKPRTFYEIMRTLQARSIVKGDCYLWQGHTVGRYGVICWQGKQVYIHRLVYEQHNIDAPKVVRHMCDNPRCWNIAHLLNGTHQDNVNDKVAKNRHGFGVRHYNAKATPEMVREIRASGLTLKELTARYPLTKGAIHAILTGATWKHV